MKKRRRRENIFIDLTSLLDVVMIVLLVVICRLQLTEAAAGSNESDALLAEANERVADAELKGDLYREQLTAMDRLSEYILFISVSAPYEKDLETRHILLVRSDDESGEIREIAELKGAEVTDGYTALENYLENAASRNTSKTVVLSLNENGENILYRDQERIREIFDKVCAENENVRAQGR